MFCKNCGEAMNENQAICLKCGVKKGEGNAFCANCGAAMPEGADICMNCGVAVKKESNLNGQDKTLMAVLAILLGGLGIHNFLMGETKKGVVKIVASLCCGIGWIFALIDFVKILMGTYSADPEKYI